MVDSTRTVYFTEPAKRASVMALWEVRRLHHAYRGPEHYLLGLLRQGDSLAARVLVAHGLDLETARAEVERLIAQGVLSGPDLGDAPLLASLGIDLEAVAGRLQETFGHQAYWQATERGRTRPAQAATHRPMGVPPPFVCARYLQFAYEEAVARGQDVGPEHLLLGLLRDAEDPIETESNPQERRLRGQVGLPDRGPHAIKLLVEARGLRLEVLRAALLANLTRGAAHGD
jgi:ATP-dependent Clp protease ATP-binding subunit ClpA